MAAVTFRGRPVAGLIARRGTVEVEGAANVTLVLQVHVVAAELATETDTDAFRLHRCNVGHMAGVILAAQGLGRTRLVEAGHRDGRRAEQRRIRYAGIQAQCRNVLVMGLVVEGLVEHADSSQRLVRDAVRDRPVVDHREVLRDVWSDLIVFVHVGADPEQSDVPFQ